MLIHESEIQVRFNEADPLGIVWHGHYIRYFEDGREDMGKQYGISYLDFYNNQLAVPVVSVHCEYKKPLKYGNSVIVQTIYKPCAAARLDFDYKIFDEKHKQLVATGYSSQVFVDIKTFVLQLTLPPFFEAWKIKWDPK
ncbi:MAG: acyl-CoA thioesterase [Saprospiraceae bacterium]